MQEVFRDVHVSGAETARRNSAKQSDRLAPATDETVGPYHPRAGRSSTCDSSSSSAARCSVMIASSA
jgi:hypothetical protein